MVDGAAVTALRVATDSEPLRVNVDASDAGLFAIEIPDDINRMLTQDAALASRWRAATRDAFTSLIGAGLLVTEFQFVEGKFGRVGQYLLTRGERRE